MSEKIKKLQELNELLKSNALTREEFEISKKILFSVDEDKLQKLQAAWNSLFLSRISATEYESIKNNLFKEDTKPVEINTDSPKTELAELKTQIAKLSNQIEASEINSNISNKIKFTRIIAAGISAKGIYKAIVWQLITGFIYGFLYVNPELVLSNELDIEKLSKFYQKLNIGLGITQVIIFFIILSRVYEIANNLMNVNNTMGNQNTKQNNRMETIYSIIIFFLILAILIYYFANH